MEKFFETSKNNEIVDSSLLLNNKLGVNFAHLFNQPAVTVDDVNEFVKVLEFIAGVSSSNLPAFPDSSTAYAHKIVTDIYDFQVPAGSKYMIIDNPNAPIQKYIVNVTNPAAPALVTSRNYYASQTANYSQFKCVIGKCSLRQMSMESLTSLIGMLGDTIILNSQISAIAFSDNPMSIQVPEFKKKRSINMHTGVSGLIFGTPFSHYLEQMPLAQFTDVTIFGQPGTTAVFIPPFSDITIYYIGAATFTLQYQVNGVVVYQVAGTTTTTANHLSVNSGPFNFTHLVSTTTNTFNVFIDLSSPRDDYFVTILSVSSQVLTLRSDTTISAQLTVKQSAASDIPMSIAKHSIDYAKMQEIVYNTGNALTEGSYNKGHAWSVGSILSKAWDLIRKPLNAFVYNIGNQLVEKEDELEALSNRRKNFRRPGRAMISDNEIISGKDKPSKDVKKSIFTFADEEIHVNPEVQCYIQSCEKGYHILLGEKGNINDIETLLSLRQLYKNDIPAHLVYIMSKNNLKHAFLASGEVFEKLDISIHDKNHINFNLHPHGQAHIDKNEPLEEIKKLETLIPTITLDELFPPVTQPPKTFEPYEDGKNLQLKDDHDKRPKGQAMIEYKRPLEVKKGDISIKCHDSPGSDLLFEAGISFFNIDGDITHANRIGRPYISLPNPTFPIYQFFPIVYDADTPTPKAYTYVMLLTEKGMKSHKYVKIGDFESHSGEAKSIHIDEICGDGNSDHVKSTIKWVSDRGHLSTFESDIYITFETMINHAYNKKFEGKSWLGALMAGLMGFFSGQFISSNYNITDEGACNASTLGDQSILVKTTLASEDMPLIFFSTDNTHKPRVNFLRNIVAGEKGPSYQVKTIAEFLSFINQPPSIKGYKALSKSYNVDAKFFFKWCEEYKDTPLPYIIANDPSFGEPNFKTMKQILDNEQVEINRLNSFYKDLMVRSNPGSYLNVITPMKGKNYTVGACVAEMGNFEFAGKCLKISVHDGNSVKRLWYIHKNYATSCKIKPNLTDTYNIEPLKYAADVAEVKQFIHKVPEYLQEEAKLALLAYNDRASGKTDQQIAELLRVEFMTQKNKHRPKVRISEGKSVNPSQDRKKMSKSEIKRIVQSERDINANDNLNHNNKKEQLQDESGINIRPIIEQLDNGNQSDKKNTGSNLKSLFTFKKKEKEKAAEIAPPDDAAHGNLSSPGNDPPLFKQRTFKVLNDFYYNGEEELLDDKNIDRTRDREMIRELQDLKFTKEFIETFDIPFYKDNTMNKENNRDYAIIKTLTGLCQDMEDIHKIVNFFDYYPADLDRVRNIIYGSQGTVTEIYQTQKESPYYSRNASRNKIRQFFLDKDKHILVHQLFDYASLPLDYMNVVSPNNVFVMAAMDVGILVQDKERTYEMCLNVNATYYDSLRNEYYQVNTSSCSAKPYHNPIIDLMNREEEINTEFREQNLEDENRENRTNERQERILSEELGDGYF